MPLLAAGTAAGLAVAAGLRLPRPLAGLLAALGGLAIGLDAIPDATETRIWLTAATASVLGVTAAALLIANGTSMLIRTSAEIACRLAGSWIAAVAVLYFGSMVAIIAPASKLPPRPGAYRNRHVIRQSRRRRKVNK